MNIAHNVYVAFDYELTLDSGEKVDSTSERQPLGFITGYGQIIPGLEKGMMGMKVGDTSKISVEPENAYGPAKPELMQDVPRSRFPADVDPKPGMTFQAQGPQGPIVVSVKEIKDENTVVIDLNHPLAGKKLHFDVNIVEVREPTAEEISSLSPDFNCNCSAEGQAGCGTDCEGC